MTWLPVSLLVLLALSFLAPWRDKSEWREYPSETAIGAVFLLAAVILGARSVAW